MSRLSICAVAAMSAAAAFQLSAATPGAAFDAAPVPGADILFYYNDAKVNATPIAKKAGELVDKIKEIIRDKEENTRKLRAFQELCQKEGFSDDNFEASILSIAAGKTLSQAIKAAKEFDDPELAVDDLGLVAAVSLKKPVTKDGVKKVVAAAAELLPDDFGEFFERVVTADFEHAGATGMTLTFKLDADDIEDMPIDKVPVFAAALPADGRVVFIGLEKDVRAALDRAGAGTKAEPSAELKKLLESSLAGAPLNARDFHGAFVMPQAFRDAMAELETKMSGVAAHMPPGMFPGIQAAKFLQGLRFANAYGEKLDGTINLVLNSAENAATLKDVLQINVLNMAKMMLFQLTGKNTAFAESLAAVVDAESVSVKYTLAAEDIDFFFNLVKGKISEPQFAPFFIDEDDGDDDE